MSQRPGFRLAAWDTPLRVNSHREAGRFHRAGSPATQYISLHPLGPWAEYLRFHDLRSRDDVADRRLRTWAIRVLLEDVLEVDFNNAPHYGLEPHELVSDDWTACQDLADRFRRDGAAPKALQVPSAALPGTRCLVILGERVDIPFLWAPVDDVDMPACLVVEDGRPPQSLLELVRYSGDRHAELDAWLAGDVYEFADLATAGA